MFSNMDEEDKEFLFIIVAVRPIPQQGTDRKAETVYRASGGEEGRVST